VAAVAPDSPAGAPRLLLGNEPLLWYSSGSFQPGPVLPVALTDITDVAFGAAGALLVSGIEQDPLASTGVDSVIVRCAPGCASVASYPGEAGLKFVESSTGRGHAVAAFNNRRVSISGDGGRTFSSQQIKLPGAVTSLTLLPDYSQNQGVIFGWIRAPAGFGIGVSHDAGASVLQVSASGFPSGFQLSRLLAVAGGRWFAALTTPDAQGDFGIRCSIDSGATWSLAC
jgi:hypothetical protein